MLRATRRRRAARKSRPEGPCPKEPSCGAPQSQLAFSEKTTSRRSQECSMAKRLKTIMSVFCAVLGALAVAAPAAADDGAWKAAHDTDPHVPLTPYEQDMLAL